MGVGFWGDLGELSCGASFTPIPSREGSVVCATGGDGGWRGVRVSRFLPAQERRIFPPLALREPQHERPLTGEGRVGYAVGG